MNLRCIRLHCLLHIEHERKYLVVNFDQAGSLRCSDLIFCHNCRNVVTVVTHVLIEQLSVSGILMGRVGRPWMACSGELDVRDIKTSKNLNDAGNLLGLRNIDRFYKTVGNGGADNFDDQSVLVAQIICVLCSAGCLVKRVHTLYALTDMMAHKMCLLLYFGSVEIKCFKF